MAECANCYKDINNPQMIFKYDGKVFCSEECLKEYLLERVEDEVEEEWFDTEENMKICAEEFEADQDRWIKELDYEQYYSHR